MSFGRALLKGSAFGLATFVAREGAWILHQRKAAQLVAPELRVPRLYFPLSAHSKFSTKIVSAFVSKPTVLPEGVVVSERNLDGPRVLSSSSAKAAIEDLFAQTPAGPNSVVVREYWPLASGNRPLEIADVTSVVLWFHGGGLISGTARNNDGYCGRFAQRTRSAIISVEYRLAPDYPFPAALEDGVIALAYSRQIADEIGVPLLVSGASAGGGLAAAVVQCGTDCGISIDFQGLIYPMLNARTGIQKVPGRGDFIWTAQANQYGWASYLRSMEVVRGLKIVQYAVPSDRSDFSRLPPAWIGCGELDLFYGESKTYAQRLSSSGVAAHFESVPGMYHGADAIVAEAPQMVQFTNHFIEAMNCAVKAACN